MTILLPLCLALGPHPLLARPQQAPAAPEVRPERIEADADFHSQWAVDRIWVGPEYWTNRLQDWRVQDSRLVCVQASERAPLRTCALLTARLSEAAKEARLRVRVSSLESNLSGRAEQWAGFLIGVGGPEIDWRLSAQVHHLPGEDGGLLAVVDGRGRVGFRSNTKSMESPGSWSIGGRVGDAELPLLSPERRSGEGFEGAQEEPLELVLTLSPLPGTELRYECLLLAQNAAGETVSEARHDAAADEVAGALALVSHLGPAGGQAGHAFEDWSITGEKLELFPERAYGPVLCTQYTVNRGVLKLTAQLPPLGPGERTTTLERRLEDGEDGQPRWEPLAVTGLAQDSHTATFRVQPWDSSRPAALRIRHEMQVGGGQTRTTHYEVEVRAEPASDAPLLLGAFSCNKNYTGDLRWNHQGLWFPHADLVAAMQEHDPDLLFFAGDQIYEGDLTGVVRGSDEVALLDYLNKWMRWCWSFHELTRERPTITVPDDHDVYHGNLWGNAGEALEAPEGLQLSEQDLGGYRMSPRFVNAVHRTQVAHLPDPDDPAPLANGITTYTTNLDWGGVSFAIVSDRMYKSPPSILCADGQVVNGWAQDSEWDPVSQSDKPDARLLGERQLAFLDRWVLDWREDVWAKAMLSQTIFANLATLPQQAKGDGVVPSLARLAPGEYPEDDRICADHDSGGWPRSGRDAALRRLRQAAAIHVAGDQHLGSTLQYGIDNWDDGGFALSVPAVANTFARRWYPPEPGENIAPDAPRNTGRYTDGFGNRMTVHAVANPEVSGHEPAALHDRAPGYGLVRFDPETRSFHLEAWPRWADPSSVFAEPYRGWPVVSTQLQNAGGDPVAWLPELDLSEEWNDALVRVRTGEGELLYTVRAQGRRFLPPVFTDGEYILEVARTGAGPWKRFEKIPSATVPGAGTLRVEGPADNGGR